MMLSKMRAVKACFISLSLAFIGSLWPAFAATPVINVIYPRAGDTLPSVDSSFILGSVSPNSTLTINGTGIPVHRDGGFIAFLPLNAGPFDFELSAISGIDTAYLSYPIFVTARPELSFDSIIIIGKTGEDNLGLMNGDIFVVEFRGTPGCIAGFTIPGVADTVPMAEILPSSGTYSNGSVFGTRAFRPLNGSGGLYQGYFEIGEQVTKDSVPLMIHLRPPGLAELVKILRERPTENIDFDMLNLLRIDPQGKTDSAGYFVRLNPPEYPRLVEFIDSVQTVRVGPGKGYIAIFQPRGVIARAVGYAGVWVKLQLSPSQIGWVNHASVKYLEKDRPQVISYPKTIRTFSSDSDLTVIIPLSARHPFRVVEEDEKTLVVDLFGVNTDTDWIRYDFKDALAEIISWIQAEAELYRMKIKCNRPIWGYDADYDGNMFKLKIIKPPKDIRRLKDKIIVIDPGHSADPGAVGPTGLKESEANLAIAKALKNELVRRGGRVIMTREDMSDVPLYTRPIISKSNDADLFISVHNNALPDGLNPFVNNGVSSYYYHPHSIELARRIQSELLAATGLNDFGLYYGNLAVARPTQYPSVLVETAFIILPEQEAMLRSEKFQKQLAVAIRKGIERFLREYE